VGPEAELEQDSSVQQHMRGFPLNLCSGHQVKECGFAGQKTAVVQSSQHLTVDLQGTMWSLHMLRRPDTALYSLCCSERG